MVAMTPEAKARQAEAKRKWRTENPEKARASGRSWYARNREQKQAAVRARQQLDRDTRGACDYCGAPATCFDHATPISRGGTNTPDNLVPACSECNARKGTKTVLEFMGLVDTRQPARNQR